MSDASSKHRFAFALLAIVAAAFVVRVVYVAAAKADDPAMGDELFYVSAANHLADGGGFTENVVAQLSGAEPGPAADHPPLTVIVLAPVSLAGDVPPLSWLGDDTHVRQHRYAMTLIGSLVVGLIGVCGRELGRALRSRRAEMIGLVSAGLAALYPGLWIADGLVFSEPVANACLVAALALALRLAYRPSPGVAGLLGLTAGLATLARAELALVVVLIALPVAFAAWDGRRRWRGVALVVAGAVVVVGPWVAFNLARFEEPVVLSTNVGLALAGSNCDGVYRGPGTGLTSLAPPCTVEPRPPGDQSVTSRLFQDRAVDYMRDHASRVPVVMAARAGRTWSLFRPADMLRFNMGEGREWWATMAGLLAFFPLLAVATAGALLALSRRVLAAWIVLAPALIVTIATALTYGQTRFRGPAEPTIVLLAAVASVALIERARARHVTSG